MAHYCSYFLINSFVILSPFSSSIATARQKTDSGSNHLFPSLLSSPGCSACRRNHTTAWIDSTETNGLQPQLVFNLNLVVISYFPRSLSLSAMLHRIQLLFTFLKPLTSARNLPSYPTEKMVLFREELFHFPTSRGVVVNY